MSGINLLMRIAQQPEQLFHPSQIEGRLVVSNAGLFFIVRTRAQVLPSLVISSERFFSPYPGEFSRTFLTLLLSCPFRRFSHKQLIVAKRYSQVKPTHPHVSKTVQNQSF